jgi:hypothetical protein
MNNASKRCFSKNRQLLFKQIKLWGIKTGGVSLVFFIRAGGVHDNCVGTVLN